MKSLGTTQAVAALRSGGWRWLTIPGDLLVGALWVGMPLANPRSLAACLIAATLLQVAGGWLQSWAGHYMERTPQSLDRQGRARGYRVQLWLSVVLSLIALGILHQFATVAGRAMGFMQLGVILVFIGLSFRSSAGAIVTMTLSRIVSVLWGAASLLDPLLAIPAGAVYAACAVGIYAGAVYAMEIQEGKSVPLLGLWMPALGAGLSMAVMGRAVIDSPHLARFLAVMALVIGSALMVMPAARMPGPDKRGPGILRWIPVSRREALAWWWSLILPLQAALAIAAGPTPWNLLVGLVLLIASPAVYVLARRGSTDVDFPT
ncbi:MAG: hypothetical protein KDL10_09980 [Kiritimatiellae bacterium]|nr:hypothetical protein [Kiritimatiellia bacterium]